jgi:ribosomal protein S13
MPKQSAYAARPTLDDPTGLFQNHERMKALADAHRPKVRVEPKPVVDEDAEVEVEAEAPEAIQRKQAVGLYQGPRHIGMRRHIGEDKINEELQA